MSAGGIDVQEHLMPGEADDIPPPPMTLRQWTEKQVRAREDRAYARAYEDARADTGGLLVPVVWFVCGALLGFVSAVWVMGA